MSGDKKKKDSKEKLPFKVRFRSFIAGLKKIRRTKMNAFRAFLKSKDFIVPRNSIFKIMMDGFMFSCLTGLVIGFSDKILLLKLIPILGFSWYILKKEVFPEIKKIIASINLVRLGK